MNNTFFLKVASGVFLVLFVLAITPWIGDLLKGKGNDALSGANVSVNLSSFTENSVDRIAIKNKNKDEIAIELSGSDWKVGSDLADKDKITALFQSFAQLKVSEMVSKNEGNFKKFGVTKEDGIQLTLREKNGKDQIFYIGNAGDVPQEFFIRKDGIKNAYSVNGSLRDLLTKDVTYWKKPATDTSSKTSTPTSAQSSTSATGALSSPTATTPSK